MKYLGTEENRDLKELIIFGKGISSKRIVFISCYMTLVKSMETNLLPSEHLS